MIPEAVEAFARRQGPSGEAWLERLPALIAGYCDAWGVTELTPLEGCRGSAWVGGGVRAGEEVVLKVAWPHPEAATEAAGLRFFDGRGAVRLLESDAAEFALLIERCRPGTDLWDLRAEDADDVVAGLLQRLWRQPTTGVEQHITTVADTVAQWIDGFETAIGRYPDPLLAAATTAAARLVQTTTGLVVVHGDLNPFNVLSSRGAGWVAIDPKPLIGDPAYDLAQYLANRIEEADRSGDPREWMTSTVSRLARALGLDASRVAAWALVKSIGWDWGPRTASLFQGLADELA